MKNSISSLIEELSRKGVHFDIQDGKLSVDAPTGVIDHASRAILRDNKEDVISTLKHSLAWWVSRIRRARSQDEIFALLDVFRPLAWSDEQRAVVSREYICQIEILH